MSRQSVPGGATRLRLSAQGRVDFPARLARNGVQLFYQLLAETRLRTAQAAFEAWRQRSLHTAFGEATGAIEALRRAYGLPCSPQHGARALFALQSWFALLAKLAIWEHLACVKGAKSLACPRSSIAWHRLLSDIEAGQFHPWNLGGASEPEYFGWPVACWNRQVAEVVQELVPAVAQTIARWHVASTAEWASRPAEDLLALLYQRLVPRPVRHVLGEYYTPGWLVRLILDAAGYPELGRRILDPTCGTGAFLVEAIWRLRGMARQGVFARQSPPEEPSGAELLEAVAGMDANPLAVVLARLNLLAAVSDCLPAGGRVALPVTLADAVFEQPAPARQFDYVAGNPPWIAWDYLPQAYRRTAQPLWQQYGLFSLSAHQARHGGSKKDLAMLLAYLAADRYLRPGGRLAMLVPQTVFQTRGAGDGFRRFRLGEEGEPLAVLEVHDLVAVRPFDAANWTAAVVLEKGRPTCYPVPYLQWLQPAAIASGTAGEACAAKGNSGCSASGSSARQRGAQKPLDGPAGPATPRTLQAWPIDPRKPRSPWLLWPGTWSPGKSRHPLERLVQPSDYQAYLGANTGGANGVYWMTLVAAPTTEPVEAAGTAPACPSPGSHCKLPGTVRVRNLAECGRRAVPVAEHWIEAQLLYPLLRWGDIQRFGARPSGYLLLVQDADRRCGIDEKVLQSRYPCAYGYLCRFRKLLESRAAYRRYQARGPFYAMYDVGSYTLAPYKVVWRRMDRQLRAAVLEPWDDPILGWRPVVPQETCVLVPVESLAEAHYLCALLNSSVVGFLAQAHSVRGGKGFGSPGMLEYLNLRRFDRHQAVHRTLSALSRKAHAAQSPGELDARITAEIDLLAGRLYGLDAREVARMAEESARTPSQF